MSSNQSSSTSEFKCHLCDRNFTQKGNLQTHINGVHLKVKFNCEFCDSQSTTKDHLKTHINTVHLKLKPFQCDECDQSFGERGSLKIHVDSIHKKIRFRCSFDGCEKSFSNKSNRSTHFKLHEGQVNLCDLCGKTFSRKRDLNRHKNQVHSDSKTFQCTIDGCDKSFKLKGNLTQHLKQAHGPKQHQCLICLKSFSTNQNLKTHIASVHDEMRHQCNKCTKSYSSYANLWAHIKKHHSQTTEVASKKLPFQNCLWCIWKFPNFKQFIIHAKHYHPTLVAGLLNNDDFK